MIYRPRARERTADSGRAGDGEGTTEGRSHGLDLGRSRGGGPNRDLAIALVAMAAISAIVLQFACGGVSGGSGRWLCPNEARLDRPPDTDAGAADGDADRSPSDTTDGVLATEATGLGGGSANRPATAVTGSGSQPGSTELPMWPRPGNPGGAVTADSDIRRLTEDATERPRLVTLPPPQPLPITPSLPPTLASKPTPATIPSATLPAGTDIPPTAEAYPGSRTATPTADAGYPGP